MTPDLTLARKIGWTTAADPSRPGQSQIEASRRSPIVKSKITADLAGMNSERTEG